MVLMDRERLTCIGKVVQAHGMHGELKVKPLTDDPAYYEHMPELILDSRQGLGRYAVERMRSASGYWILTLREVGDRDGAEALRGAEILLEDEKIKPLAEGEYFLHDLVGCEVVDEQGTALGRVTGVMETSANNILEVASAGSGAEVLVPLVEPVLLEVNVPSRLIRIAPLPGLFAEPR